MCKDIPVLDGEKVVLKRMINGSLRLGQPESFGVSVIRADEYYGPADVKYVVGLEIKGYGSKLSLILSGEDIKELTSVMWDEYIGNERTKAIEHLKDIFPVVNLKY